MFRRDYLMRVLHDLAEALARIVGAKSTRDYEEVLRQVENAKANLPLVPGMIDTLEARSVRLMLGGEELIGRVAELYRHEAEACLALGQRERALRCLVRAQRLVDQSQIAPSPRGTS
jgi:hypothetical protein